MCNGPKKQKLKILYLDQHYAISEGMTIPRSYELTKHLAQNGHEIIVISGMNRKSGFAEIRRGGAITDFVVEGIRIILIGIPYTHFMSYPKRVLSFLGFMGISCIKAVLIEKPDVVFATSTPLTIGVPALAVCKLRKVPFVFEVRDLWPEFAIEIGALRNRFLIKCAELLERVCYRNAHKILTISDGLKQRLIDRGIPREKMERIPIGVDLHSVQSIPVDKSFRRTNALENKFVAVYAGAHGSANGLEILIEASYYLKSYPEIIIVLIGEGKLKDDLIALKEKYGLKNILFLDAMLRNNLISALKDLDVGLMITKNLIRSMPQCPNLPRKFFDYLACGLPVLVNVEGDISALIGKYEIGLVCQEDDAEGLAKRIMKLYDDKPLHQKMCENTVSMISQYDIDKIAPIFEKQLMDAANLDL